MIAGVLALVALALHGAQLRRDEDHRRAERARCAGRVAVGRRWSLLTAASLAATLSIRPRAAG